MMDTLSPLLVLLDDDINKFGISESSLQTPLDHVWVMPLLGSEPVNIQSSHLKNIQEIYNLLQQSILTIIINRINFQILKTLITLLYLKTPYIWASNIFKALFVDYDQLSCSDRTISDEILNTYLIIIYYVMESEISPAKGKIIQSIERSSELLSQNKEYEFAQKIKSLAQRKMQTNKAQQAEWFLYLGSEKMLQQQKTEINAVNELITALLDLYQNNKTLVTAQTSSQLYKLLNIKENPNKLEYYARIIKSISSIAQSPEIVEDYINYFEYRQQFWKVQSLVVHLSFARITSFLQKWKKCIDEDEFFVVVCRMILLKGLYGDFDEPMVLLSDLPGHNPFVKLARFLIQSVQMKSKECYQKIGTSYEQFLKSDDFFQSLYEFYGVKFFKKEKKESQGLMGLFKSLE